MNNEGKPKRVWDGFLGRYFYYNTIGNNYKQVVGIKEPQPSETEELLEREEQ